MTFAIHNLGCKVNTYEADAMICSLRDAGYEETSFGERADIYIINTCTVTNVADRKSRQMLHRARKLNPDAVIIAAGCYVDAAVKNGEAARLIDDGTVDIFISNREKGRILEKLEGFLRSNAKNEGEQIVDPKISNDSEISDDPEISNDSEINNDSEICNDSKKSGAPEKNGFPTSVFGCEESSFNMFVSRIESHTRAFIKVQDGCNQFCSYCIIPYVRGRIVSRPVSDCVKEIKGLSEKGIQEVVLTGIHLTSYGKDWTGGDNGGPVSDEDFKERIYLLELIKAVHEIEGIKRIRLGSLEPHIITEDFVKGLSELEKFCPHFHLSLQSGSDTVLRRMNRHYTSADYKKRCELLRKYFEHPAITTDVIAGFPGETDKEFLETLQFVKAVGFYEMHIFKYSRRRGTRADRMEGQVPEAIKTARSERLLRLADEMSEEFRAYYLGRELSMLPEELIEVADKQGNVRKYVTGYTKEYVRTVKEASDFKKSGFISGKASDICKEKAIYESLLLR